MSELYTAMIFMCVFAMVIMEVCVFNSALLTRPKKKHFGLLFSIIAFAAICEWTGNTLQNAGPDTRFLHIVVKALELSISPFIAILFAGIVGKTRAEKPIFIFMGFHALLEIASGFFGFIYAVDENSVYTHAACYWIYIIAYMLSMIYALVVVFINMKKYQYNGSAFLALIALFVVTGVILQLLVKNLNITWMTISYMGIMIYVFNSEMVQQNDPLTMLINRRGYESYISHVQDKVAILVFDVDKFKAVNDTYGHAFGDTCLKAIGRCIRDSYGRRGKCFRIGGDEFCVILDKNSHQLDGIVSSFFNKLDALREKEPRLPFVSVGYVIYDPVYNNIEDAVHEADDMMYKYKKLHRRMAIENLRIGA